MTCGNEPQLDLGEIVYIKIPWPSGPESGTAHVTEIVGDSVVLKVELGSGWRIVVDANIKQIRMSRITGMWHLEGD